MLVVVDTVSQRRDGSATVMMLYYICGACEWVE
jgi:hypothetical protein